MVFHRLFRDKPELIIHLDEKFRQILSGGDPGVLGAILCLFIDFVKVSLKFTIGISNLFFKNFKKISSLGRSK